MFFIIFYWSVFPPNKAQPNSATQFCQFRLISVSQCCINVEQNTLLA